ncbi:c-type cytochrome [Herminiimonas fonticola]|uniref:Mono/diheme cytochrome c family protein n=1 Tax=Herminiimonas fonticola TaxID=303380 RepID=A0A4R6GJ89_9BURK|nr:cytochrome c [Herminiimonas fonticola]RBA25100.1 Cytochrome C oxidase, cbb3-type, subunit III [Herminiimonas fonticola]TDN94215.1 mono/diheme cytochrome c family protein [Herminiimonas fonticola]
MKRKILWNILALLLAIIAAAVIWLVLANRNPDLNQPSVPPANLAEQIKQGEYLARVGNCMSCHTARGSEKYAGGRAVPTPFGNIYTSNLTPDAETGIGKWNNGDFWQAMHNGKSKDGSLLYPAFPYTNYTKVTRADSDAIFAYLQTLQAVTQKNIAPELRFPYDNRALLYVWRALYFRPGQYANDDKQSVEWNRGAYLAQGLGHCSACHSPRDSFGGINLKAELGGGMIPVLNWYAPPLNGDKENGLGNWEAAHLAAFLKTGVAPNRSVSGPMAEVVAGSSQHMNDADINALSGYLKSLPQQIAAPPINAENMSPEDKKAMITAGAKLYENQCATCHQASGKGVPSVYPALAGSSAINTPIATNAIRMVLHGGYAPSTVGNPRPYGMPPFGQSMSDEEVANVLTYVRNSWGNQGNAILSNDVNRYRSRH